MCEEEEGSELPIKSTDKQMGQKSQNEAGKPAQVVTSLSGEHSFFTTVVHPACWTSGFITSSTISGIQN